MTPLKAVTIPEDSGDEWRGRGTQAHREHVHRRVSFANAVGFKDSKDSSGLKSLCGKTRNFTTKKKN